MKLVPSTSLAAMVCPVFNQMVLLSLVTALPVVPSPLTDEDTVMVPAGPVPVSA